MSSTWRVGVISKGRTVIDGKSMTGSSYNNSTFSTGSGNDVILQTSTLPDGISFQKWEISFSGVRSPEYVSPCTQNPYTIVNSKDAASSGTITVTLYLTSGSSPEPGGPSWVDVGTSASPLAGGITTGDGRYTGTSGQRVTYVINAVPNPGYAFDHWQGPSTSYNNARVSISFLLSDLPSSRHYVAYFSQLTYTVTTSPSPSAGGSTYPSSATGHYGDTINISATANAGYIFTQWSDGNVNSSRSYEITGNVSLIAYFAREGETYTITTRPYPTGGGITSPASSTVNAGDSVTVTQTAAIGYVFEKWRHASGILSYDHEHTFIPSRTETVYADYLYAARIKIDIVGNGSVSLEWRPPEGYLDPHGTFDQKVIPGLSIFRYPRESQEASGQTSGSFYLSISPGAGCILDHWEYRSWSSTREEYGNWLTRYSLLWNTHAGYSTSYHFIVYFRSIGQILYGVSGNIIYGAYGNILYGSKDPS